MGCGVPFVARLAWYPAHQALLPHGGLNHYLSSKLGSYMWPIVLIAFGFVSIGTGAIWFLVQVRSTVNVHEGMPPVSPPSRVTQIGPVILASEVEGHIEALDRLYTALEKSGGQVSGRIAQISFPWAARPSTSINYLLLQNKSQPNKNMPLTKKSAEDSIPELRNLVDVYKKSTLEIIKAERQYPYENYLEAILGSSWNMIDFDAASESLIVCIQSLDDNDDLRFIMLKMQEPTRRFYETTDRFNEWLRNTKKTIQAKREAEVASLQQAYRN